MFFTFLKIERMFFGQYVPGRPFGADDEFFYVIVGNRELMVMLGKAGATNRGEIEYPHAEQLAGAILTQAAKRRQHFQDYAEVRAGDAVTAGILVESAALGNLSTFKPAIIERMTERGYEMVDACGPIWDFRNWRKKTANEGVV